MTLSSAELERYSRQLRADGWDQAKLRRARVLVVGVGGLGGVSATWLAAAGVGHLRLCDGDRVELSNLNRQVLFAAGDIGRSKAPLAAERLSAQNPEIEIEVVPERLTEANAGELVSGCDLVIDGLDSHAARATLNQTSFQSGIPFIHGAVGDWLGQLGFFNPPKTACLACLLPGELPDPGPAPVFGALPGAIGALQATLALRYLMTGEAPVCNALLILRAATMALETVTFERKDGCAVCGKSAAAGSRR